MKEEDDYFFVFYAHGDGKRKVRGPLLPRGWFQSGSGGWDEKRFPNESQYTGPLRTRKGATRAVRAYFNRLKQAGRVKRFKIVRRIRPRRSARARSARSMFTERQCGLTLLNLRKRTGPGIDDDVLAAWVLSAVSTCGYKKVMQEMGVTQAFLQQMYDYAWNKGLGWRPQDLQQIKHVPPIRLPAGTTLYRTQPARCAEIKPRYDSDTGKTGMYFSSKIYIPVGMILEYKKPMDLCVYETTADLTLFAGKYVNRDLNPVRVFKNLASYKRGDFTLNLDPAVNWNHIDDNAWPIHEFFNDNVFADFSSESEIFIGKQDLKSIRAVRSRRRNIGPEQALEILTIEKKRLLRERGLMQNVFTPPPSQDDQYDKVAAIVPDQSYLPYQSYFDRTAYSAPLPSYEDASYDDDGILPEPGVFSSMAHRLRRPTVQTDLQSGPGYMSSEDAYFAGARF